MRSTTLKTLLILLVLLSSSFALQLSDFRLALPLTVSTVIIGLVVTYLLSQAIQNPQLNAWVKTEIRELVVAAILMVIVMSLFTGDKAIIKTITGDPDFTTTANGILTGMKTTATNAYLDDMKAFHLVGLKSGFSTSIAITVVYFGAYSGGSPFMGYSAFFVFLSQAATGLSNIIFVYTAIAMLMDFFLQVSDKLIFVAFAFRFIPFTRQLGNTLIGFFVGVYVILPLSILIVGGMHNALGSGMPQPTITRFSDMEFSIPTGASFICSKDYGMAIRFMLGFFGEIGFALPICIAMVIASLGFGASIFNWCMFLMGDIVYPLAVMGVVIAWDVMMIGASGALSGDYSANVAAIFNALQPFLQQVNNLVVLSYVDAILIMAITYIGAKAVSTALGGEYLMPGVQRLVG